MNTQPTVDGPPTPESQESPFATVSRRAARRAAARRASTRRHPARDHKDDLERRIVEYLKGHPRSTTGDIAKGLNADRGTVAAGLSHVVRAGEIPKG
jgi:hypothetical protein